MCTTVTDTHAMGIISMSTEAVRRTTKQRTAVRALLADSQEFRTAQQVHEQLRSNGFTVGLATVYRALQTMAEDGDLDILRTPEGETAYRRCSDGHHHHLVCRRCGATVEISANKVEKWATEVAKQYGFSEVIHDLELFGICSQCQE
ncbi:MAG: transcriptional repressor [Propionibacterium sp.]|nr:MAG: transcriptional repressor [Propionibacterium sp.]